MLVGKIGFSVNFKIIFKKQFKKHHNYIYNAPSMIQLNGIKFSVQILLFSFFNYLSYFIHLSYGN